MLSEARRFPLLIRLRGNGERSPFTLAWEVLAPHEPQALKNHGQSLERLAARGGLNAAEALAVLEDRPWRDYDQQEALRILFNASAEAGRRALEEEG